VASIATPAPKLGNKQAAYLHFMSRSRISGQVDKLENMRTAYRRATGKRLNEQELMRLIIDRLELSMLL
jgi:hypothetical protein